MWSSSFVALVASARRGMQFWLLPFSCAAMIATVSTAAEPAVSPNAPTGDTPTNSVRGFDVQTYVIKSDPAIFTNVPAPVLSTYTGTNVSLDRIVQAASEVLLEYQKRGYSNANISIAQEMITNGIVTMHVFNGAFPQVLISGQQSFRPGNPEPAPMVATAATNAPAKTNAPLHLSVHGYEITGNTLLSDDVLNSILGKHTGTNIVVDEALHAASDLQTEYRVRGYPTVSVAIPPQAVTNGIFKIQVFEGRLSKIRVTYMNRTHYFGSNNVMRALPSLHTNSILIGPVFQAELDRANASQDRQIYPELTPGEEPGTSDLNLKVKDRFPLHAKTELNNQSTPGTPDLRVNTSAVYNDLWDLEHSLGVQYSFSPEQYKAGDQWNFYDRPLVANSSAFYRLPLGGPVALGDLAAVTPGTFGYDEATRKFRLPPPSGSPELNIFASRSTIDTGLTTLSFRNITDTNLLRIDEQDVQQDLTINNDLGFRLSLPLMGTPSGFQSAFSGGLDYKTYSLTSYKTNVFLQTQGLVNTGSVPPTTNFVNSTTPSPVPTTFKSLRYVPLTIRYDGSQRSPLGVTSFGLGLGVNLSYSGTKAALQNISGSPQSTGHWVTLAPSITHDFTFRTNWTLTLRADGQWSSEPLISNEQYSAGGLASVRGYHEGAVLGDTGWHISLDQKTPAHFIGRTAGGKPLTVRGSIFMDYAEINLLDPQGRQAHTSLWGLGFGGVADLGANWEARLFFSWPLLNAGGSEAGQPRFDFSISAQF